MKTTARLPFSKVRFDLPFRTHLAVSLEAPPVEWERTRPPVCVVPVIDVSGSMQGEKLEKAKRSVQKLIDQLAPGDRCGVVTFSSDVEVIATPMEMTAERKAALRTAVERLHTIGQTNLAGGMLAGLRLGNDADLPPGMLVRVILFTDGCANHGVATTSEALVRLLGENLGRATLSAFGYGADADQDLLRDLSTRGKGNYAFVAGPDDALTAFARELGGLLSTFAQDIVVRVRPRGGCHVTTVLSDVDADPRGSGVEVRIPDILAEETRHVVLAVELPEVPAPGRAPEVAFEVELSWKAHAGGGRLVAERRLVEAVVERVLPGHEQLRPDRAVDVVVAQAELVRTQIEAEELARRGEHDLARERVFALHRSAVGRGLDAEARAATVLADKFASRAEFERSAPFRASMRKGMERSSGVTVDADAGNVLAAMGYARATTAQATMGARFHDEPNGEPGATPGASRPAGKAKPRSGPKGTRARRW